MQESYKMPMLHSPEGKGPTSFTADEPAPPQCPKCKSTSGNDWSQCAGSCPMPQSPHYTPAVCQDEGCPHYGTEHGHSTPAPARPYLAPKQSRWGRLGAAIGNSLGQAFFGGSR